jgi:hypothetical protein
MKLVFSRKGFDSGYGGVPSPIFEDGSMLSFPIPSRFGRPARDLRHRGTPIAIPLQALTGGRHHAETLVHLDPDLEAGTVMRSKGWRPAFGQVAAAQQHLANQRVGVGDIFLFFGWFRRTRFISGMWSYDPAEPSAHTMFGWLQVGEILAVAEPQLIVGSHPWLANHPHVAFAGAIGSQNTIYVAAERLTLSGQQLAVPGAGVFPRWSTGLQLTAAGCTRSIWDLPGWMMPGSGLPSALTYHGRMERWEQRDDRVRLASVAKGQEFVQDIGDHGEALAWVRDLLVGHASSASWEQPSTLTEFDFGSA